eukprot:CAMPEP_0185787796 /NCGR_PEP_ID=MMETSP1174-20130828/142846_1 /TAXON_ID=35687 /ORGANISM="Dictyocha speculum, Strain CCMP1381" /LENGTH=39 /DNA_ID= /DNA_START= /DNA_END= /DNA_ORIENTATION=
MTKSVNVHRIGLSLCAEARQPTQPNSSTEAPPKKGTPNA